VVPILKRVKDLGCRALFDCTAAYFGRDVRLLRKVSEQTGLHIITNTGYYGAADDRYVPPHALRRRPSNWRPLGEGVERRH
jgi:phosphotriesterase-related protein